MCVCVCMGGRVYISVWVWEHSMWCDVWCILVHIFTVILDSLFLAPTQPNKNTYVHTPSPPVCAALFGSLSCCESSSQLEQENTHTRTHKRTQVTNSNKAQSSFPVCAQTVWHLVYALGASAHPFHPSKEACHWASSLPQVASLELTCYLPASCAWSFPMAAQGAPCVESHTPRTHMPASPGSEIGQEARLETPLLSLSGALVSPAAYFCPLTHTSRQLPSSINTDPCWQTDSCCQLTPWFVCGSIAAYRIFWLLHLIYITEF